MRNSNLFLIENEFDPEFIGEELETLRKTKLSDADVLDLQLHGIVV